MCLSPGDNNGGECTEYVCVYIAILSNYNYLVQVSRIYQPVYLPDVFIIFFIEAFCASTILVGYLIRQTGQPV